MKSRGRDLIEIILGFQDWFSIFNGTNIKKSVFEHGLMRSL